MGSAQPSQGEREEVERLRRELRDLQAENSLPKSRRSLRHERSSFLSPKVMTRSTSGVSLPGGGWKTSVISNHSAMVSGLRRLTLGRR